MPGKKAAPVLERFMAKVMREPSGCWRWGAAMNRNGYGMFHVKTEGKWGNKWAHRIAYEIFVRPLLPGETIDHLCRNTACVNPEHLEPVSLRENNIRSPFTLAGANVRKTHCPRGHSYSEVGFLDGGKRKCRICVRAKNRKAHARRRDQKRLA